MVPGLRQTARNLTEQKDVNRSVNWHRYVPKKGMFSDLKSQRSILPALKRPRISGLWGTTKRWQSLLGWLKQIDQIVPKWDNSTQLSNSVSSPDDKCTFH